jgi:hypothetical protein
MPQEMVCGLPLIVLVPPIALPEWYSMARPPSCVCGTDIYTQSASVSNAVGTRHVQVCALVATRLDEGDAYMGKRVQPVREHQTGRAAADDHVVKSSVGFV